MNEGLITRLRSTLGDISERANRERALWGDSRCELSITMKARSGGLTRFEIVGTTLEQLVFASWDGLHLKLSTELWSIISSVSECFETIDGSITCSEDPRIAALRLVQSLDCLFGIEYSVWCDRLQERHTWNFARTPSHHLVGGQITEKHRY